MPLTLIFIFIAAIILGSAIFILITKSVLNAAYMLLVTFLGVAAIFVLANADFLAISQLMIYTGGILVLIVFGILLTNKTKLKNAGQTNIIETKNYNLALGGFVSVLLFVGVFYIINSTPFSRLEGQHFQFYEPPKSSVQSIGYQLITENSIALEIVGILLIGALIGAGFIAVNSLKKENVIDPNN